MKCFLKLAGGALALTGLAKAVSAIGSARALDAADPLVGIPFRQLLLLVGLGELVIAFLCLFTDRRRLSLAAVAWLATNFLVYRLGLWFIDWHHPCGCMGSLAGMLHLSDRAADNIMKGVLAYLLVGSYGILLWEWRRRRVGKRTLSGSCLGWASGNLFITLFASCAPMHQRAYWHHHYGMRRSNDREKLGPKTP